MNINIKQYINIKQQDSGRKSEKGDSALIQLHLVLVFRSGHSC